MEWDDIYIVTTIMITITVTMPTMATITTTTRRYLVPYSLIHSLTHSLTHSLPLAYITHIYLSTYNIKGIALKYLSTSAPMNLCTVLHCTFYLFLFFVSFFSLCKLALYGDTEVIFVRSIVRFFASMP